MQVAAYGWLATLLAAGLLSCSIHPLPEDVTRKTTYEIVEAIRCEARDAIIAYALPERMFDNAFIGYEFQFQITEDNNASASADFKHPFTGGTFTLGISGGAEKQRVGDRNFRIVESFRDLRNLKPEICYGVVSGKNYKYPIAGTVGLAEVIQTYVKIEKVVNLAVTKGADVPTFADKLVFTTTLKGGAKPSVELQAVPGSFRLVKASGDFNAQRKDVHKLIIAIALDKRPAPVAFVPRNLVISPLAATAAQAGAPARTRVLLELDRQRLLEENQRLLNLLGVTP
jgi:hypothetical protein